MKTQGDALKILGEVYRGCSEIYPSKIQDAYLYGSYARGDYDEESDVDIFLTVDMDWDEIDRKRHSGVISEFRRLYIKTGVFDESLWLVHFQQGGDPMAFFIAVDGRRRITGVYGLN